MTTPVQYTGNIKPFFELPITGQQGSWMPNQVRDRTDADAALLIASGVFSKSYGNVPDANADATDGIVGLNAAQASALVFGALMERQEPVQRPWRWVSYGDSRAGFMIVSTQLQPTGNGVIINHYRTAPWLVGALGDSELVGNFGVAGENVTSTNSTTGWLASNRPNGKLFTNLVAGNLYRGGPADVAFVQYGINDYIGGISATTVTNNLKALCAALMGAGMKVVFEATNPVVSANFLGSPATKLQAVIDGNAIMKTWLAGFPKQAVYADTFSALGDATGYLNADYSPVGDGTHFNALGAMISAQICAAAARTILPKRYGLAYSCGSLTQPNLVDWSAPYMAGTQNTGTITFNTPTWNIDSITGMPYAEITATCTALASNYARGYFEVGATTIAGATALFPIKIGDELQSSGIIAIDNGAGGLAPIQMVAVRNNSFDGSASAWSGQLPGDLSLPAAKTQLPIRVNHRLTTPTIVSSIANVSFSAPGAGGYSMLVYVEFNATGTARIRVYAPTLRCVNEGGAQPTTVTASASPYTYQNTSGSTQTVYVAPGAGGTISKLEIARQGTLFDTLLTSGPVRLAQNDSVKVTWATTAANLTVLPDEPLRP